MEDYQIDFEQTCPKCGHGQSHYRNCDSFNCNDGVADEHFDDPINFPIEGSTVYSCPDCKGKSIIEWCPKCGHDY